MMRRLMVVAVIGLVTGLVLVGTSWSYQAPSPAVGSDRVTYYAQSAPHPAQDFVFFDRPGGSARSEIGQLMNQLREADDDKKADLTKQLEAAVAKYFDEDMKARETELTKLEERLNKLRTQLDRRRKAKTDIIQLQIKVLVNEAEGLGLSGHSFFDFGSFHAVTPFDADSGYRFGAGFGVGPGPKAAPAVPANVPAKR